MNNEKRIVNFSCKNCDEGFRVNKNDVTPVDKPTGKEEIGYKDYKSEKLVFVNSEKINNKDDEILVTMTCPNCEGEMFAYTS